MSKISDEIREFVKRSYEDEYMDPKELLALADRIDAEMIELPKSADGKMWTGREVCFWTNAEQEGYHQFDSLTWRNGIWFVEDINNTAYTAESVSLERPDSLERIAHELEAWCDDADVDGDACEKPRDIVERIRKLAAKGDE